jgi:hypothetical protein
MTRIAKHTLALMAALVITVLSFSEAATVPLISPGAALAPVSA